MCGIAGWFGPPRANDAEALRRALFRRGPDGSGVWRSDRATLVHTRLAILDLSEAAAQPMKYECIQVVDGRSEHGNGDVSSLPNPLSSVHNPRSAPSVLTFNGEIYNFHELRAEREAAGERFESDGDTEVLLRLLVREGAGCLSKLAGMFAFAFWNEGSAEALLARDAFGIKPLYYRIDGGTLAFASEASALRQTSDRIDANALRDYFLWGSVPEPATLYQPIRQLPAGHMLRWKDGEVRVERWHRPAGEQRRLQRDPTRRISRPEAVVITRAALEEGVRRHLVSDVPVGIFLSGGIDSTAVLALARTVLGPEADIRTFSIGFDDTELDESSIARRTAEWFGTRHTEWRMTPEDGAAEIPAFLAAVDQPSIDGFNTWCVSKLARQEGMKVVLSGLGGDEWFAGYRSFEQVPRLHRLHRVLGPLRPFAARMLDLRPPGSPWRRLAAFLRGGGSWLEAFHAQRGIFTAGEARQLAEVLTGQEVSNSPFADALIEERRTTDSKSRGAREIVSGLEVTRYMRNQLLRDSDVFSMAHGLELRVPFVDVRLAEVLWAIPPEIRLRQGKHLLLEAVPEVPEWVWNQPKRGFRFPFQQWMEGQFGELMEVARQQSPVSLNAWYRVWAVAAAFDQISPERPSLQCRTA